MPDGETEKHCATNLNDPDCWWQKAVSTNPGGGNAIVPADPEYVVVRILELIRAYDAFLHANGLHGPATRGRKQPAAVPATSTRRRAAAAPAKPKAKAKPMAKPKRP